MLVGKTLEEAKEIKNKDIANALDLPPIKIHCSVLAEDSIHKARGLRSQSCKPKCPQLLHLIHL